jgi:flavin-dependent dehydrogenase
MSRVTVCDAFVVGGGPAGLAAAIALRQRGAEVTVADALEPPIDKACGEGIMPDSLQELARLGVHLDSSHGVEVRGVRFCDELSTVSADFPTGHFPNGRGIGVRRLTLHRQLVDRATEIGVRMLWGSRITLRRGEPVSIAGKPVSYRYLIGADGQSSRVRSWAGLDQGRLLTQRFGLRVHFRVAPWSPYIEVHWGVFGQAYVTPVGNDEVCVVAMAHSLKDKSFEQMIDGLPSLKEKLRDAEPVSRERGSVTTTCTLKRVTRDRIALVGDASGSADAITGEGLAMGFRQAMLLAEAVSREDLAVYQAGHASLLRLPQTMARVLLLMDRWRAVRRKTLRILASEPHLFDGLLRVHIGEERRARFIFRHATQLGCRMLLPLPA